MPTATDDTATSTNGGGSEGCGDGEVTEKEWCHEIEISSKTEILQIPGASDIDLDGADEFVVWGPDGIWLIDSEFEPVFVTQVPFSLESRVQIGDFEGDGWRDVFLQGHDVVGIIHNNGGLLNPEIEEIGTADYIIHKAEVLDVDGDEKSEYFGTFNNDAFLHHQSDGTLDLVQTFPELAPCAGFEEMRRSDLNGDGFHDIVLVPTSCNIQTDRSIFVLLGSPDGHLDDPVEHLIGSGAAGLDIGDVDGDHVLDIIAVNTGSEDISVLLGDGGGSFGAQLRHPVAPQGTHVAAANLDGIVGDEIVFRGEGGMTVFSPFGGWNEIIAESGYWIQKGDLNLDNVDDLVFGVPIGADIWLAILMSNP